MVCPVYSAFLAAPFNNNEHLANVGEKKKYFNWASFYWKIFSQGIKISSINVQTQEENLL